MFKKLTVLWDGKFHYPIRPVLRNFRPVPIYWAHISFSYILTSPRSCCYWYWFFFTLKNAY